MSVVGVLVSVTAFCPPLAPSRYTVSVGSPIATTFGILYVPSTALHDPEYEVPPSTTMRTGVLTPSQVPPISGVTPSSAYTVPETVNTSELSSHRMVPGSPVSLSNASPSIFP